MLSSTKEIDEAGKVEIRGYLLDKGIKLVSHYFGRYSVEGIPNVLFRDQWYCNHDIPKNGNAIEYCMYFLGMTFDEAVKDLLSYKKRRYEQIMRKIARKVN